MSTDQRDGPPPEQDGPADAAVIPDGSRAAAETVFGDRLPLAREYARLLASDGVVRGLIGPRETPRLWDRHLLNCAVVAELVPTGASAIDVGSGAGLPGVVLAIARDDLTVTLLEPMARRTAFLDEVVTALELTGRVDVVRARAEETGDELPPADVVTARALAPLDRLAGWCLPLTVTGGRVLAIKGASADAEITAHAGAVRRLGGDQPALRQCGVGLIEPPATVVEVVKVRSARGGDGRPRPGGPDRSRRGGRQRRAGGRGGRRD